MKYGFWIRGSVKTMRHLVDVDRTLAAYAACSADASVDQEGYLSAFAFDEDFKKRLVRTGSTRGFDGSCSASHIHWDVDRTKLEIALEDTRRLAIVIRERYGEPLVFFSGAKGFHLSLPVDFEPLPLFNRVAKAFALAVAADIEVDASVYDKVRAFRAPNSRHAKSGLYKVRLSLAELGSDLAEIQRLATEPRPFELPRVRLTDEARLDWQKAQKTVEEQVAIPVMADAALNRLTLDFLREGVAPGQRARRLFSAAANLAEFGCSDSLAHALLTESALDCGLSPGEVRREIECGLQHGRRVHRPPSNLAS